MTIQAAATRSSRHPSRRSERYLFGSKRGEQERSGPLADGTPSSEDLGAVGAALDGALDRA